MVARTRRILASLIPVFCLLGPLTTCALSEEKIPQGWEMSSNAIAVSEGVFLKGEVEWTTKENTDAPVVVRIDGKPVKAWRSLTCVKWVALEKKDTYRVFIDLFFDFMSDDESGFVFFNKPGKHALTVLDAGGKNVLLSSTVVVRGPTDKEREAFRLFSDRESVEALTGSIYDAESDNDKGLANLTRLTKEFPDSPWAKYARISLGIILFQKARNQPIMSNEEIQKHLEQGDTLNKEEIRKRSEKKRKDIADLAPYFETMARGRYCGEFSMTAKFYLGWCLALKGEYDASRRLLTDVAQAKMPKIAPQAESILKEIETHEHKQRKTKEGKVPET